VCGVCSSEDEKFYELEYLMHYALDYLSLSAFVEKGMQSCVFGLQCSVLVALHSKLGTGNWKQTCISDAYEVMTRLMRVFIWSNPVIIT
jgi:hypothetical protein